MRNFRFFSKGPSRAEQRREESLEEGVQYSEEVIERRHVAFCETCKLAFVVVSNG